jgi:hypothetical protein
MLAATGAGAAYGAGAFGTNTLGDHVYGKQPNGSYLTETSSAIFVEEDDSQNGVDHVDGHRNIAIDRDQPVGGVHHQPGSEGLGGVVGEAELQDRGHGPDGRVQPGYLVLQHRLEDPLPR